jgi:hypothetical protein
MTEDKMSKRVFSISATLIAIVSMILPMSVAWAMTPTTIYDSIPSPLPPNVPSVGFQATSTQEFGDHIRFASTKGNLTTVTVTMSDWALHSTYPGLPDAGWQHDITLNIYNVNNSNPIPAVGTLLTSKTQTFVIPWRPVADPTCPGGTAWKAGDNQCYNGYAFNITFDFTSLNVVLPDEIIYGIAYNTNTWGYHPIGLPGPYESLNVGLNSTSGPTVGTDVNSDVVFWNTSYAGFYSDGGAGGVGTLRADAGWSGYVPAVQFKALPNSEVCKNDGWKTYGLPSLTFKSQGDCIQYFNTGK